MSMLEGKGRHGGWLDYLEGPAIIEGHIMKNGFVSALFCVSGRLGKTGSLGPWSRAIVCCSKPSFCQNDPPFWQQK